MNESPMLTLDKTALQAPVSDQEASAEAPRRLRAADGGDEGAAGVTTSAVVRVVVLVLGAWALAVVFVRMVQLPFGAPNISIFTICVAALMVVPIAVAQVRGFGVGMRDMHRTWYRLARFADANQLECSIRRAQVPEGATLFRFADKGVATDVVTRPRPREFEAANYAFDTWAGRTRMPHSSAYVAFSLSTGLPVPVSDQAREERRRGLFRLPGGGRRFLIGCLVPPWWASHWPSRQRRGDDGR